MNEIEISAKEKNKILKAILKKTHKHYERILSKKENVETITSLDEELKQM